MEEGKGEGTSIAMVVAQTDKGTATTHNSSVTKWHLLIFCCTPSMFSSSSSFCLSLSLAKKSKIFAESSETLKVAQRVS